MKRILYFVISVLVINVLLTSVIAAQTRSAATKFRLEANKEKGRSILYAAIDGKEIKISEAAFEAWLINDGQEIVYSGAEDEYNESLSLRVYDVKTGETKKVIFIDAAYYFTAVKDVKLSNGKRLLFVITGDEVAGASHFWIVDTRRGAIFYRDSALLTNIKGDIITLAFYRFKDWEVINEENYPENNNSVFTKTKVKPSKTRNFDLKKILTNKTIDTKKKVIEEN